LATDCKKDPSKLVKSLTVLLPLYLLFCSVLTFGQPSCDTLSTQLITQYDSYSQQKFEKLRKSKRLDMQTAYEIATYFRLRNDNVHKEWYCTFIELVKQSFNSRYKHKDQKAILLYQVGLAYYYSEDYLSAKSWFIKAQKARYQDRCLDHFYNLTLEKLGDSNK
jgi:hypothetical protein